MSHNSLKNDSSRQISHDLTVFVVDDDEDIRRSLTRSLERRDYRVECFASAREFLTSHHPDRRGCLVLDHGLPGMTGLELQSELNNRGITLPIIFITGHGGIPESVQAIKGGAVDFLEKPFRQQVLTERIETAFQIEMQRMSHVDDARAMRHRFHRLTPREREIADHIRNHPSAISSKEIALHLGISPRTVDHHRARILEKMGVKSVAELIALQQTLLR